MERVIIEEQSNEFFTKDLPQLIVALDKEDNYIHIRDAKENVEYFCPCCRNSVKPRAFKTEIEYQVQPHFYHVCGSCDEESRVHWIYKNWLFKEGSQFHVGEKLHTVESVEIEKSYDTSFGKYRPDLTVNTECGKVIFFEINFTSAKKEDDYFAKWDELNIDVIEVNIKKLMNEDYDCKIPTFSLVYSDGECFKQSYLKRDEYSTIANIKREWKRQEKIDYKIMWEKLDWFWLTVQDFKHSKCGINDVLESFQQINIKDKEVCFDLIKKQSCIKEHNQSFRNIINDEIKSINIEDYFKHHNIRIISCKYEERKSFICLWEFIGEEYTEIAETYGENRQHYLCYSKFLNFVDNLQNQYNEKTATDKLLNHFYNNIVKEVKNELQENIDNREAFRFDIIKNNIVEIEKDIKKQYCKQSELKKILVNSTDEKIVKLFSTIIQDKMDKIEKEYNDEKVIEERKKILQEFKEKFIEKEEDTDLKLSIWFKNDIFDKKMFYCSVTPLGCSYYGFENINSSLIENCFVLNNFEELELKLLSIKEKFIKQNKSKIINNLVFRNINEQYSIIKDRMNSKGVWELGKKTKYADRLDYFVKIKNSKEFNHMCLIENSYLEQIQKMSIDEIILKNVDYKSIFISNLTSAMNTIHNYVSKHDGIDSEYRHMFIGGTKFDTNK